MSFSKDKVQRVGRHSGSARGGDLFLRDYHLDDIESKEDIGIAQQPEPGQATERNPTLLLPGHRFQGPAKILPGAGLDLHENKRIALAADEIDLAALASAEVAVEDLETVTS